MKNFSRSTYSWLCMGLISLVASCSSNNTQTATLQVKLTDAPGDYQEVNVDIQDVQVNADASNSNSGWISIIDKNKKGVYNLLEFTNELDTLLGSHELPAGKVSQIRLVLGSNNTIKIGDQSIDLSTPSAEQSGLKILVKTDLKAGVTYTITLDFDAAQSIVQTGNTTYILKPVIRSIVEAQSGAIKGMVAPAASTPAVYAMNGTTIVETTYADDSGKFLLKGLAAGSYTISFAPNSSYNPPINVDNVSVTVGNVTDIGTVVITHK